MRRFLIPVLLILLLIGSTGCWSRKEINELAIFVALGMDWEGGPAPYRLTGQIAKPTAVGRGGAAQGEPQRSPFEVMSAVGRTPSEAGRYLQRGLPRGLYSQHNEVWIVGEKMARQGIGPALDYMERAMYFRPNMLVLVTKGSARDVMQSGQDLETTLSQTVTGLVRFRTYTAATMRVTVHDLGLAMTLPGLQAVIPALRVERAAVDLGKPAVFLEDMAMLKGDRLVGWLSGEATEGFLWLRNKVARGSLTVPCPGEPGRFVTADVIRGHSRQRPALVQGRPVVFVHVDLESELISQTCRQDLATEEGLARVTAGQRALVTRRIEQAIAEAKAVESDVLGFGERFHETQPTYWHRVSKGWDEEVFPQVEARIDVTVHVRRAGMITRPTWSSKSDE